jgi:HAE1 family hydrophobic/amphiphilic exporter-1
VLVSLYISFTLDPMLSAYWGDPPRTSGRRAAASAHAGALQHWFDHQSDRYGNVHRLRAAPPLVDGGVRGRQPGRCRRPAAKFGGSSFLPQQDVGMIAIDVRTPSSASLDYARLKVEKAAELARTLPETKATNSQVNAAAAASTSTSASARSASAMRPKWRPTCAH